MLTSLRREVIMSVMLKGWVTGWYLGKLYGIVEENTIGFCPKTRASPPDVDDPMMTLQGDVIMMHVHKEPRRQHGAPCG